MIVRPIPLVALVLFCLALSETAKVPATGELVKKYGLECEKHEVKTEDGYILNLHRIPSKDANAPVVFIQHGLMLSSDIFAFTNNSLGIVLAKDGYDVWLGNARGNVHSRKHDKLTPTDEEFWNFSWYEMGVSDLPAVIDFILAKTKKQKLNYVGHSMGTTMFYVLLSEKPEYNDKINQMVALAPVVYCTKYQFLISNGSAMHNMMEDSFDQIHKKKRWEAFPRADVPKTENQVQCEDFPEMAVSFCNMALEMAQNKSDNYVPAGSSLKSMWHYLQSYATGKISRYNYRNPEENQKMYKQPSPPSFNLKNAKVPVHIFYAEADQLVDESDVDTLAGELPNVALKFKLPNENFNHIDFVYQGSDEVADAYNTLLSRVKDIVKK